MSTEKNDPLANWVRDMEQIEREIAIDQEATQGKRIAVSFSYTAMGICLIPFASFLLALIDLLVAKTGLKLDNYPELEDAITGVVSASIAFPLFLANKITHPTFSAKRSAWFIAYLTLLSLILFVEYRWLFHYFSTYLSHQIASPSSITKAVLLGMQTQWLYAVAFVVILINMLMYSRSLPADFAELTSKIPDEMKAIPIAIIAVVISAIFRLIAAMLL